MTSTGECPPDEPITFYPRPWKMCHSVLMENCTQSLEVRPGRLCTYGGAGTEFMVLFEAAQKLLPGAVVADNEAGE